MALSGSFTQFIQFVECRDGLAPGCELLPPTPSIQLFPICSGIAGVCYAAYIGQMSQQVGIAYELYAIAAAVLGGVSLRGGEGTVIGTIIGACIMRVIDNGINMFQWSYRDEAGTPRIFRLDNNWTFIIIGGVILAAVVLDQIAHIFQDRRRTRRTGPIPPPE